jgi:mono/diheme cytochrome c family protein
MTQDYSASGLGKFSIGLVVMGVLVTAFVVFMAGDSAGFWGGGDEASAVEGGGGAVDMAAAQEVYTTRCVTCHGPRGAGDGPASAGLTPRPRNLTDPTWQAGVTDEHIERIIVGGGAAVGMSPAMPNNPDLREKPEVVAGLRQMIRGFGSR